jgi:hypothetical protein
LLGAVQLPELIDEYIRQRVEFHFGLPFDRSRHCSNRTMH